MTSLGLEWPEQSREQELVQGDSLQQQPPAQMRFKHAPYHTLVSRLR